MSNQQTTRNLTLSDCLRPAPAIVSRLLEDEAVLVHPTQGEVKVLNELGAYLWARLDGQKTIAVLADQIQADYEVSLGEAQHEALAFLQEMYNRGLILLD